MLWSVAALAVAILTVLATYRTCAMVAHTMAREGIVSPLIGLGVAVFTLAAATLLIPAARSLAATARMQTIVASDAAEARVATAAARSFANYTFGYSVAVALVLLFAQFIIANKLAVGKTFFYLPLIGDTFWLILGTFWINVQIFCIAQILVLVWGLVIAIARIAPGEAARPVRLMATMYVDLFRALPAIISIYLIGFGLPIAARPMLDDVPAMWLAILALMLTYGAYVSEVYRAGIESVHWSQTAAARSLGLTYGQTMRYVIVPQAVRRIIPPLLNDFISLQKDTALVSVIGTIDAFNQAKMVASNHFNLSSVTTVAILFVIITIPQARFVDRLMAADQQRMRAGS
jgi:polar amino acid transport system permease protein